MKGFFWMACFALLACQSTRSGVTKGDIRHAQHLIGINLGNDHIGTMQNYLNRNLAGYDSLREAALDIELAPALYFDPRPNGFVMPDDESSFNLESEPCELPENLEQLAYFPISKLAYLISTGKISSVTLTQIFLERIKKYDGQLHAVITATTELAMQQARRADEEIKSGKYRGLLHGIPYGIKDLMAVAGYPTTWGAKPYQYQMIDYNAKVVQQLTSAGAVLVAKLSSGALARGDVWFQEKTRNPWDVDQGASGSSAGSGSATAAGLVAFSIGTETLGSIVSPSNRCGVTGLRTTYGRVSRKGVMTLSWSMDKVGPICRSAKDCAIVLKYILEDDDNDPLSFVAPYNLDRSQVLSNFQACFLAEEFNKDTTSAAPNRLQAVQTLKSIGLTMDSVSMPRPFPLNFFDIILRAESGAFFDQLVLNGRIDDMIQQDARSRANSLRQSRFIPAVEYLQANRYRKLLIEEMDSLMQIYDVIVAPTFGGPQLMITNLTGHPAIAIPAGLDEDGRPTSITLIGRLFDEATLLEIAMAFQQSTSFEEERPPAFP